MKKAEHPAMKPDSIAVEPKSSKVQVLGRPAHFSRNQLTSSALIFAVIGDYILYRSFAASTPGATLQAEQMSLPAWVPVFTDSSASGGKAVAMLSNGASGGSVNFPSSVTSFIVTARTITQIV
jgi:hypothetical protein